MARTKEQILAEIQAIRQSKPELANLNSVSETAIYKAIEGCVAYVLSLHEGLWDLFRTEITELIATVRPGDLGWYADQVRAWQFGYALNEQGQYAIADDTAKIITRVSVKELSANDDNDIRIKVAKNEPPVKLSELEKTSLLQYIGAKKYAGVHIDLINKDSDKIQLTSATVYYTGIGDADAVNKVLAATRAYLSVLSGAGNFDGVYVRNDHIARVRQEAGIVDFVITTLTATPDGGSPVTVTARYESEAGHFLLVDSGNVITAMAI